MEENTADRLLRETDDLRDVTPVVDVPGMSSPKVCQFLNRLVAHLPPGERYLEVGTWQGLTLLSAAYGNLDKVCIGCDKFRLWGRWTGLGWAARRAFQANLQRLRRHCGYVHLYEMSDHQLFARRLVQGPIGVYFYDGDHSRAGTRRGIADAAPLLSRRAVVLVDDWNISEVRQGARDGLRDGRLAVLWQRELPGDHTRAGWWNGLGAFFVERAPGLA
jgi:hypothetical protein